MNILRLMGQRALLGPDAPIRHSAKRRRIKTVMQELIYRAGRLIEHGRRIVLGLGANDRAADVFTRSYAQFAATQWRARAAQLVPADVHTVPAHCESKPAAGLASPGHGNSTAIDRRAMPTGRNQSRSKAMRRQ